MMLPDDASTPLLRQRRSLDILVCMLVVSLLLHLAASVIFVLPGRLSRTSSAPLFLDLQNLAESPPPAVSRSEEAVPDSKLPVPVADNASAPTAESAKLEQAVAASLRNAQQATAAVHESSIGLGMLSGHFASFAEGATLKDDIRVYYFELMRRINEAFWTSGAAQGSMRNAASIRLIISRQGTVLDCELLESSGSREQDKVVLAAVKLAAPLPPLPQSYIWPTFDAPIRFVPPLRLMLPGLNGKKQPGLQHGG